MKSSFESDSRVSPIFTFSVDWKVKSCWIFHEFLMTEKERQDLDSFDEREKSFFHIVLTTHSTRQPLKFFVDKFSIHEFSSSIRTTDTCKFNYIHQPNTRALLHTSSHQQKMSSRKLNMHVDMQCIYSVDKYLPSRPPKKQQMNVSVNCSILNLSLSHTAFSASLKFCQSSAGNLMKFQFSLFIVCVRPGAKSQIISTIMRADIPMELCTARTRRDGIPSS